MKCLSLSKTCCFRRVGFFYVIVNSVKFGVFSSCVLSLSPCVDHVYNQIHSFSTLLSVHESVSSLLGVVECNCARHLIHSTGRDMVST